MRIYVKCKVFHLRKFMWKSSHLRIRQELHLGSYLISTTTRSLQHLAWIIMLPPWYCSGIFKFWWLSGSFAWIIILPLWYCSGIFKCWWLSGSFAWIIILPSWCCSGIFKFWWLSGSFVLWCRLHPKQFAKQFLLSLWVNWLNPSRSLSLMCWK